ncbi:DUF5076 domain-containing protein [Novipirellula caenicola]|uniref:DUF5076 domain-containing protein n=1 Tax=Novipirellula caenicola TaxID=1536901 RepID=A0ABP9W075_9BACT
MHEKHEPLPIPAAAEKDPKAIEMFRGWIADGALHCEVNVGHWHKTTNTDERQAWGVILADLARQIAKSLEEATGMDQNISLPLILQSFAADFEAPESEQAEAEQGEANESESADESEES